MLKRIASTAFATTMMLSITAALPVSAETTSVQPVTEYSVGALSTPKIVKAAKYTDAITLKWTKVKGATGYKVYKKVGKKYKIIGTVRSGSKVKYKIKGLKSGKKYNFKVRAFKKGKSKTIWSKYSAAKVVMTKADYTKYEDIMVKCAKEHSDFDMERSTYMMEDLNNDGVKELLVEPYGSEATRRAYIFGYNCGDPKLIDSLGFCHSALLKKDNKYNVFWAIGGHWGAYRIILKNGKIKTVEIDSGEGSYPSGDKYGNSVPEYDYYDRSAFYEE